MTLPRALTIATCVAAAGFATSGCSGTTATPPTVVSVTTTPTGASTPDLSTPDKTPTTSPTAAAVRKRIPDVVGMNLQMAQDKLQATGFWVLNDKDASGLNRFQVIDSNWEVVRQTPAAGRRVSTDTLVTLYAKKIGE